MLIRALPSTGKSYFANSRSDVVDTDDIVSDLVGEVSPDSLKRIFSNDKLLAQLVDAVSDALKTGHVVTNLYLDDTGLRTDVTVGYSPDDYIEHIKIAKRTDLLEGFGEEKLRSWAADAVKAGAILLRPDQFLSHLPDVVRLG